MNQSNLGEACQVRCLFQGLVRCWVAECLRMVGVVWEIVEIFEVSSVSYKKKKALNYPVSFLHRCVNLGIFFFLRSLQFVGVVNGAPVQPLCTQCHGDAWYQSHLRAT